MIRKHIQGLQTLVQVRAFVSGNEPISLTLENRHAAYGWITAKNPECPYVEHEDGLPFAGARRIGVTAAHR
jgi:hypothetical protein